MMNHLFSAIVVVGLVGTFAFAPTPAPVPRSVASQPMPSEPAAVSTAIAASNALPSHQPPVPVVRSGRALPATATSPGLVVQEVEAQPQDDLDRTAARTAIEADGYRGVTVLGKGEDGTWRAKAYRGTAEVQLILDGTGRVSAE